MSLSGRLLVTKYSLEDLVSSSPEDGHDLKNVNRCIVEFFVTLYYYYYIINNIIIYYYINGN